MAQFKITVIDTNAGNVASEIVESCTFPCVTFPQHCLSNGAYGLPVKVELVLEDNDEQN